MTEWACGLALLAMVLGVAAWVRWEVRQWPR